MELRQLRYFLEIARLEHLTQAARALSVTQSTLSHQLRQLEDELGTPLFDRVGRQLHLTQAGHLFATFASRALRDIKDGQLALKSLTDLESGELRVGVITTYTNSLLPQAIATFTQRYPGIRLFVEDLPATRIAHRVQNGTLDLGLAFTVADLPDLITEPLFSERLVLLVRNDHPLAQRSSVQGRDLAKLHIVLQSKQFASRQLIDRHLTSHLSGRVRMELDSIQAMQTIVSHSDLACIMFEGAVLGYPNLQAIPFTSPKITRTAALLRSRDRFQSAAAREFAAIIKTSLNLRRHLKAPVKQTEHQA